MTTKTKLTVLLPDESLDALDYLASIHCSSKTAALVRSIKSYRFLVDRAIKGEKILLRDEQTDAYKEVVLL